MHKVYNNKDIFFVFSVVPCITQLVTGPTGVAPQDAVTSVTALPSSAAVQPQNITFWNSLSSFIVPSNNESARSTPLILKVNHICN